MSVIPQQVGMTPEPPTPRESPVEQMLLIVTRAGGKVSFTTIFDRWLAEAEYEALIAQGTAKPGEIQQVVLTKVERKMTFVRAIPLPADGYQGGPR